MNHTLHTSRRAFSARTTLAVAAFALVCGGCAFDQPLAGLGNILGSVAEAKTAAGRGITGDIDVTKAQRFLHGRASEESKVAGEKYTDQGKDKYVLVEEGDVEEGDMNFVVSVFVKDGEAWKLESQKTIEEELPHVEGIKFQRTASGKQGVLIVSRDGGNKCESYYIEALMLHGGEVQMSRIEVTEACDFNRGYEILGFDARFDAKSSSDDIIVSYKNQNKPRNRRWRLQNGEYQEVKAAKKGGAKKRK